VDLVVQKHFGVRVETLAAKMKVFAALCYLLAAFWSVTGAGMSVSGAAKIGGHADVAVQGAKGCAGCASSGPAA
jgi:hypothetical protein